MTFSIAQVGIASEWWRQAFALVGAVVVGSTAWARLAMRQSPPRRFLRSTSVVVGAVPESGYPGQTIVLLHPLSDWNRVIADVGPAREIDGASSERFDICGHNLGGWQSELTVGARVVSRQPFCTPGFPFLPLRFGTSCVGPVGGRHISNNAARGKRAPGPSMARSGRRPATPRSPEPQWRAVDFLPLGFAHSSRVKKVSSRHPPLRCGPKRVRRRSPSAFRSPSRPWWSRARQHQGEVTWLPSAHSRNPDRNSRAKS